MKETHSVTNIHLFTLTLFLLCLLSCSKKKPNESFRFNYPSNLTLMDSGIIVLADEVFLFNAFFINHAGAKNKVRLPLLLHRINHQQALSGTELQNPLIFPGTEHIRHLTTLQTPWGPAVLFADHGVDYPRIGTTINFFIFNHRS